MAKPEIHNTSIIMNVYVKVLYFCGMISNELHAFASVHQQRADRKLVYTELFNK